MDEVAGLPIGIPGTPVAGAAPDSTALAFQGSGGTVFGDSLSPSQLAAVTPQVGSLVGWVRVASANGGPQSLLRLHTFGYGLSIAPTGEFVAGLWDGSTTADTLTSPQSVSDDAWHAFALTFDVAGSHTLFIDGIRVGQHQAAPGVFYSGDRAFSIGQDWINNLAPFFGQLDDVAIFDRVLTEAEIAALAASATATAFSAKIAVHPLLRIGATASIEPVEGVAAVQWYFCPAPTTDLSTCSKYLGGPTALSITIPSNRVGWYLAATATAPDGRTATDTTLLRLPIGNTCYAGPTSTTDAADWTLPDVSTASTIIPRMTGVGCVRVNLFISDDAEPLPVPGWFALGNNRSFNQGAGLRASKVTLVLDFEAGQAFLGANSTEFFRSLPSTQTTRSAYRAKLAVYPTLKKWRSARNSADGNTKINEMGLFFAPGGGVRIWWHANIAVGRPLNFAMPSIDGQASLEMFGNPNLRLACLDRNFFPSLEIYQDNNARPPAGIATLSERNERRVIDLIDLNGGSDTFGQC